MVYLFFMQIVRIFVGNKENQLFNINLLIKMKKLNRIFAIALVAILAMSFQTVGAQSLSPSTKWHWDKGTIVIDTPERPAGQEHVLG